MISEIVSVVSILIALVALLVTMWQTRENSRYSAAMNSSPIVAAIWSEWRSEEFREHMINVVNSVPETWPTGGIRDLASNYRDSAYAVIYYFNQVGTLVAFNLVSEELIIGVLGSWIMRTWRTLEPLIMREREIRSKAHTADAPPNFSDYYEHLVQRVLDLGGRDAMDNIQKRIGLRRLVRPIDSQTIPKLDV
jgi:hypothetical protein